MFDSMLLHKYMKCINICTYSWEHFLHIFYIYISNVPFRNIYQTLKHSRNPSLHRGQQRQMKGAAREVRKG